MKSKLKEIETIAKLYQGKEVLIWLANVSGKEPYAEGEVKTLAGGYLMLKNTLLLSGRFLADWEVSAAAISRIELKRR